MIPPDAAATHALRDATARLGAVQAEIITLTSRAEGEWRRELVALRRRLQLEIGAIAKLVETLDIHGDQIAHLRTALSRMRSKVALHQANWPAVAIDRSDPGYRTSVQDVRSASREFVALVARLGSTPAAP